MATHDKKSSSNISTNLVNNPSLFSAIVDSNSIQYS